MFISASKSKANSQEKVYKAILSPCLRKHFYKYDIKIQATITKKDWTTSKLYTLVYK